LADINGDGLTDIIGFAATSQLVAFANGNGGFSTPFTVGVGIGGSSKNFVYFHVIYLNNCLKVGIIKIFQSPLVMLMEMDLTTWLDLAIHVPIILN